MSYIGICHSSLGTLSLEQNWSEIHILYSWYRKVHWRDVKLYPKKQTKYLSEEVWLRLPNRSLTEMLNKLAYSMSNVILVDEKFT